MSFLQNVLNTFAYITTGTFIAVASFYSLIDPGSKITSEYLWQVIITSAVCAFGVIIFHSNKTLTKKQVAIRYVIHYLYNGFIVIVGALIFNWAGSLKGLFILYVYFTVVYILVTLSIIKRNQKIADEVNERLKDYHANDE